MDRSISKRPTMMNVRDFLKKTCLLVVVTIAPFNASADESLLSDIKQNSLNFFSTGDQIIADKNGTVLKTNDGEIITNIDLIKKYSSKLTKDMITKQIDANDSNKIDFNQLILTRADFKGSKMSGSEITILYNNYGKAIESIDSLGETRRYYYDGDGNQTKIKSSRIGTIYYTDDKNTVIIEDFNGNRIKKTNSYRPRQNSEQ